MRQTVAFVLSAPRSGSTWLSYVLGSHPDAAFLGEYYRFFEDVGLGLCSLCHAQGEPECEVLHGIDSVAAEDAYRFAFERTGRVVLVDASKSLAWVARFRDHSDYRIRLIHLVRDPRGWFASERRRLPMSPEEGMDLWLDFNRKIEEFTAGASAPARTFSYDDLAAAPDDRLPAVTDFLGLAYHRSALDYWSVKHHGPAGNGAARDVIGGYSRALLETGDDEFYRARSRRSFHDRRWESQLDIDEIRAIEENIAVRECLSRYGLGLSAAVGRS